MRTKGVTLIELLVAIAVLAIIAVLAAPALSETQDRNQAAAISQDLHATFSLARSTAIVRQLPVGVCASANGSSCAADRNWTPGWIMFETPTGARDCADADGNGRCDEHGGEILQVHTAPNTARLHLEAPNIDAVVYRPSGLSETSNGSFRVCRTGEVRPLAGVVVSNAGRLRRLEPGSDANCS